MTQTTRKTLMSLVLWSIVFPITLHLLVSVVWMISSLLFSTSFVFNQDLVVRSMMVGIITTSATYVGYTVGMSNYRILPEGYGLAILVRYLFVPGVSVVGVTVAAAMIVAKLGYSEWL